MKTEVRGRTCNCADGSEFQLPTGLWSVLYCAVDFVADPGNAGRKAGGRPVRATAGGFSLRALWKTGAAGGLSQFAAECGNVPWKPGAGDGGIGVSRRGDLAASSVAMIGRGRLTCGGLRVPLARDVHVFSFLRRGGHVQPWLFLFSLSFVLSLR